MINKYINGILKAVNGVWELAVAGTDYLTPTGDGSGLTGISTVTSVQTKLNANVSTTSATLVDVAGVTVTIQNVGKVFVEWFVVFSTLVSANVAFGINRDSAEYILMGNTVDMDAEQTMRAFGFYEFTGLSTGSHTFTMQWSVDSATTVSCSAASTPARYQFIIRATTY